MSVRDNVNETEILKSGKLPGPLLDRLISTYRTRPHPRVTVAPGYGRDAAAIDVHDLRTLIVKTDPITFTSSGAAHYLIAVNANDIACMGGIPEWITVVALFPEGRTVESDVERVFRDLQSACDASGIALIGGHTEVTAGIDRSLLIGTMIGVPGPRGLFAPGRASAGDALFITRHIGLEGTAIIATEHGDRIRTHVGEEPILAAKRLLHDPGISVVADAVAVLSVDGVTALHDPTEGGVATAVHELCEVSGTGARVDIDSFPVLPSTAALCDHFGLDPIGLLSSGALMIACDASAIDGLREIASTVKMPLTHIGHLTDRVEGIVGVRHGLEGPLPRFDRDELILTFV